MAQVDFDVAIVGAGMSGLNMAYHVQEKAPPGTTYKIFDARDGIGGTWDLFRYPGIRTDSDAHSFGFSWNSWREGKPLASGGEILNYMRESAALFGIDKNILFHHRVLTANWSSANTAWSLNVQAGDEEPRVFRARLLVLATGYFDHDVPLEVAIPGIESFQGPVLHPQFWPEDFDYSDKNVVVIGSGATAVTIVPAVADKVKRVTMLQRSPSYFYSLPTKDPVGYLVRLLLPWSIARRVNRARWIVLSTLLYYYCRLFPKISRAHFTGSAKRRLPKAISWDPHFKPSYNPWEQRLCLCPDGDFFKALRSGKADVVTDTIKEVTADSIELNSGAALRPDIIVTATGLKMNFGGSIKLTVDDVPVDVANKFMWRGSMLQDVPNMVFTMGYFNASFTLGSHVTAELFNRLLWTMESKKVAVMVPKLEHPESMKAVPLSTLNSTYMKVAEGYLPKGGQGIWAPKWNYMADMFTVKFGDVKTDLHFMNGSERVTMPASKLSDEIHLT